MSLHDQIGQVINTEAFERTLESHGFNKIEFQCTWNKESGGDFAKLRPAFKDAIRAGERELAAVGEVTFA